MKHQDESNKEHTLKKQLDSLRQDFLEKNKLINHLFKEYKSLSSFLQAIVSPWLPQKPHNENSNVNINSSPACNKFETSTENLPKILKGNRGVPPNRLNINKNFRNNNGEMAPNKLIIDEQSKNNIQECFSKKEIKMNLENQSADICKRKHQAFISRNAIIANDSLITQKVRDNISVTPESTETTNHKNKNDSKNANTKYKKIKKKTVLVVGDSMVNGIEESKLSKTRHIRVQPIPGGKIEDIQQILKDLLHEDLETVIIHAGTNNATTDTPQTIIDKLITLKQKIEGSVPKYCVIISDLIVRTDNTKANSTIQETNRLIKELQIQIVDNSNISEKHLVKKRITFKSRG